MKWARLTIKEVLKIALPVAVAALMPLFYPFKEASWCTLTTFTIVYACRYKPLRHGFITFMNILCAVFVAFVLTLLPILFVNIVLCVLLFIAAVIYRLKPGLYFNIRLNIILFVSVLCWYGAFYYHVNDYFVLRTVIENIFIGGVIAFVFLSIFFPYQTYRALQQSLVPILTKLHRFAAGLGDEPDILGLQRMIVNPSYPNWVYEPGFNPGLRGGFRYFLIHLEMLMDFYVTLANVEPSIKKYLTEDLLQVKNNNTQLLAALLDYFVVAKTKNIPVDLTTDIVEMEKTAQSLLPASTQMLDLAPDYIPLQSWVRLNKDIRQQLLMLLGALP